MYGLGPHHIQSLCVGEMGMGFTPKQVGGMTLDNIFMIFADKKILRKSTKRRTTTSIAPAIAKDGTAKGRAEDGTLIKGRVGGKSLARQLMEEEEKKKLEVKESVLLESKREKRSRKREERKKIRQEGG